MENVSSHKGNEGRTRSSSDLVSNQDLEFFKQHGYVVLRGVLPLPLLDYAAECCQAWVDVKIAEWVMQGLLPQKHQYGKLGLEDRFLTAWNEAGKPNYNRRQILHYNINPRMYKLLTSKTFVDIAEAILGTPELSASPTNNLRPKHHSLPWTTIPWHADLYYWEEYQTGTPLDFVAMWYPLHSVKADQGCLQAISMTEGKGTDYKLEAGKVALPDDISKGKIVHTLDMEPGDILCMCDNVLHRSVPNKSDRLIWTLDNRYEVTAHRSKATDRHGFVCRSEKNPASVTTCEQWVAKQEPLPPA